MRRGVELTRMPSPKPKRNARTANRRPTGVRASTRTNAASRRTAPAAKAAPSTGKAGKANGKANAKANGHAPASGRARGKRDRRALPVLAGKREQVPCLSCGLCCGYVAVEVEGPGTVAGATQILWYLYHQGVSIYADEGEWMVQFETRCQHLLDDRRCAIYEQRPPICREYDETTCEVNSPEIGTSFYNSGEFLTWLAQNHKRVHSIIVKNYMPPEHSRGGRPVSRTRLGPFAPRFERMRAIAAGNPAP